MYTNINIHLYKTKEVKGKPLNYFNNNKKLVNLIIGDKKVLSDIDLFDDNYKENDFEKNIMIKISDGEILYSLENQVKIIKKNLEMFDANWK